jgi:Icc-related predicted phosphoesterase
VRILAAADIHGQWPVYEWLLTAARDERVAAIVLAGDLLSGANGFDSVEESQQHEARALVPLLDGAGVPVLYLMGNDDLVELNPTSERIQSVHGKRVQVGRFAFAGYQYSLPWMGGIFEKPESGIDSDLDGLARYVDSETIFVSHSPAFGILDGPHRIGSRALLRFLGSTGFRAHIHGHSHAGFGRYENHFNVASAGHHRAMVIDLETLDHRELYCQSRSPGRT